jgi:hypothetical protein
MGTRQIWGLGGKETGQKADLAEIMLGKQEIGRKGTRQKGYKKGRKKIWHPERKE